MSFPMALAIIITSHIMLLVAVVLIGAIALDAWVSRKVTKLNRDFQEAYKRHPANRRPPAAK